MLTIERVEALAESPAADDEVRELARELLRLRAAASAFLADVDEHHAGGGLGDSEDRLRELLAPQRQSTGEEGATQK
ncbi:MAG TPA: hypothetical protein VM430_08275 [Microbacterium sp.]|jgi:hypothetical protein|nr:hypothetical protein [Microbacterium sp.]